YYDLMLQKIKEFNLENRVFIRPFRKEIVVFYKAIDAFVMASKAETFGMVTIEALASGIPVIGSNAGGTPEILNHGEFGVLFETLNADDLAQKINYYFSNKQKWTSRNLQIEAQKYNHHSVCEQIERQF